MGEFKTRSYVVIEILDVNGDLQSTFETFFSSSPMGKANKLVFDQGSLTEVEGSVRLPPLH